MDLVSVDVRITLWYTLIVKTKLILVNSTFALKMVSAELPEMVAPSVFVQIEKGLILIVILHVKSIVALRKNALRTILQELIHAFAMT